MTPEDLTDAGIALYGAWGWQTRLASTLRVDYSTVKRWVSGASPISGPVQTAVEMLLRVQDLERKLAQRQRPAPRNLK